VRSLAAAAFARWRPGEYCPAFRCAGGRSRRLAPGRLSFRGKPAMGILDPGFPARIFDLNETGANADLPPAPPGESGISVFAALLLPELADWQPVLDRAGVPFQAAVRVASNAGSHGTTFLGELLASGAVEEVAFYRAIAQELGVPFQPTVDAGRLLIRDADCLAALRRPIPKLLMARWRKKPARRRFWLRPTGRASPPSADCAAGIPNSGVGSASSRRRLCAGPCWSAPRRFSPAPP
jgi:hypothetical protein